ncbi:MAG: hypothetical protein J6S67_01280 [Methanobrevibacter sp.]|nr:hypothetical protein [Methanobrevibacter sp.]
MDYRVAVVGRRKLRNTINERDKAIQQMNDIILDLESQIETKDLQIANLESQLYDAIQLAQQRLAIINRKNGYIQDLQTILDNNGIPYPPEPTV